ncbi:MAG: hypothetical protein A3B31_00140 [Candidatus Komeilibacteria bacterium RIFCSPLOWO2_01_FULL_53_11]|uniref:Uncharacterized protein n=1 Tax=Candidatus Komeilibacteria bacterium RIFCSPLOWO2_01_FULL_53_11 TaxID=1798552 RepID=A0A1G2BVH4_9BACT|nr:MAG: hypothetical protein A3B31_00140 [Candidatus Komeilibacteria bacterium RIFCSPLOWO2_01_FULL_53_11]
MQMEEQLADWIEQGLTAPGLKEDRRCFFWPYPDGLHTDALGFAIVGKHHNDIAAAQATYHSFLFPKMDRIKAIAKTLNMPEKFVDRIDDLTWLYLAAEIVAMLRNGEIKA